MSVGYDTSPLFRYSTLAFASIFAPFYAKKKLAVEWNRCSPMSSSMVASSVVPYLSTVSASVSQVCPPTTMTSPPSVCISA